MSETMEQKIFPIELVLNSMKDNGYKDAAHAIAELIDNSIQAGEKTPWPTHVELLCLEESEFLTERSSSRIEKIAVYDNACGMDKDSLRASLAFGVGSRKGAVSGIGKFGMGLPNASISQCNRIDVYSWQNSLVYHTYLDINEIAEKGYDTIPEPQISEIPAEWKSIIASEIQASGTLVVWSDLDRLKWRRHKAFFSNVEFIVGRMYRYFINNECTIRMAAHNGDSKFDEYVKPNDPLYLMQNTNTPLPFDKKNGFIQFCDPVEIPIIWKDKEHRVTLKFSIANHAFRKNFNDYYTDRKYQNPGDTPFGKHCAKNLGISIVRAGRELELNNSFTSTYDSVERWWGAELSFDPDLDEVFGVTNNKQAATAFKQLTKEEIAIEEGIASPSDAEIYLRDNRDIRYPILVISQEISSKISAIRAELKRQTEGKIKANDYVPEDKNKAETTAESIDKSTGIEGESDRKSKMLTPSQKEKELSDEMDRDGVSLSPEDKSEIIRKALASSDKFIITSADIRGADIIFDITTPGGKLKITLNESHPVYENLFQNITGDPQSFDMVRLLFAAWGVMEDKQQDNTYKEWLLEARKEWGYIAKKMLQEYFRK